MATSDVLAGPRSWQASPAKEAVPGIDPLVPTVFHNPWWLVAATGGAYQEATLAVGNQTVARLPYVISRKMTGQRVCTMPELTHFLGAAIDTGTGTPLTRANKVFQRTQALLEQLRPFEGFYHKMHGGITDVMAYQEAGYDISVQFTHLLPPQADRTTWRGMRDKTRNVIRRAQETRQVSIWQDPDAFAAFYAANLRQRGQQNYYTKIAAVTAAAIAHGQGRITAIKDQHGVPQGAICVVWDRQTAYYLLATRAVGSDNGVMAMLVWDAIREASAAGLAFDFDGVLTPGNRVFFAGFGGEVAPRYIASRYSLGLRAGRQIIRFVNHGRARVQALTAHGANPA